MNMMLYINLFYWGSPWKPLKTPFENTHTRHISTKSRCPKTADLQAPRRFAMQRVVGLYIGYFIPFFYVKRRISYDMP